MKASDLLQAMLDAGSPIEAAMIALRALEAKDAYAVHTALLDQERRFPALKDNPAWLIVLQDAYEAFALAFGGEA